MRRSFQSLVPVIVLASLALTACDTGGILLSDEEGGVVVEPGKEDNFLSTKAQEYMVEGKTTVTIEADLADATEEVKLARVKELIPLKQVVIAWFLNSYVVEKSDHDANKDYGGFSGMTKNGSWEELGIAAVDATTYEFTFRQEMGGKLDMLSSLPTTKGSDGRLYFDLTVGRIDNDDMARLETNSEWYRDSPWSEFDASKVDASRLETLRLAVWAEPRSIDSWIDYNRLFEDGVVTIAVYWGWDYHKEYHLLHSEAVYEWLVKEQGFVSPVERYADYSRTSGPLTRTIDANGKAVEVRITLHWGKPGTDADPDTNAGGKVLEGDMRQDFAETEVIVFSGHSGPFYGFALANWRKTSEGDLDDSEVPFLDMPADVYQIVHAEGCDTYGLGEAFRMNPAKAGAKNIDVITTTSFSNASTPEGTKDFLKAIFGASKAKHVPQTWSEVLSGLEDNSYWFNTMYGVHGLDDNPHRHPYANLSTLCGKCTVNADCGGEGNRCSKLPNGGASVCTFACTADDGCPTGYQCMSVANGSYIKTSQCVPANLTCSTAPVVTGPVAIINEVLAAPGKADQDGDANGDGKVGNSADEFVEIVNTSGAELDLSGWMIADSWMTRITFPAGTKLAAGRALVVFGGGDPAEFGSLGGSVVREAGWAGLGLNNSGDTVYLRDAKKKVVDKVSFGSEAGKAYSIVRKVDGDPAAPFVVHPGVYHTAGLKQDGSTF